MKFNKKYLLNFLFVALNQFSKSHASSVSQKDLDNFSYGTDEFTMTIHGDT